MRPFKCRRRRRRPVVLAEHGTEVVPDGQYLFKQTQLREQLQDTAKNQKSRRTLSEAVVRLVDNWRRSHERTFLVVKTVPEANGEQEGRHGTPAMSQKAL